MTGLTKSESSPSPACLESSPSPNVWDSGPSPSRPGLESESKYSSPHLWYIAQYTRRLLDFQTVKDIKLTALINLSKKSKVQVFDTPHVVNCFKVESDATLLPKMYLTGNLIMIKS